MIYSLINAVLHALDDAITPAAYWVLELVYSKDDLQQATGEMLMQTRSTNSRRQWEPHV